MIVLIFFFFFLILVIEDGILYLFDFSIFFFFYPEFLPLVVNCSYNTNIDTNSLNSIKSML